MDRRLQTDATKTVFWCIKTQTPSPPRSAVALSDNSSASFRRSKRGRNDITPLLHQRTFSEIRQTVENAAVGSACRSQRGRQACAGVTRISPSLACLSPPCCPMSRYRLANTYVKASRPSGLYQPASALTNVLGTRKRRLMLVNGYKPWDSTKHESYLIDWEL